MTDCGNAEIRDLLPDLAAEALSPVETTRVQAHVQGCVECAQELALLRTARAIRPKVGPVDVARIVAQLPRPVSRITDIADPTVISLDAHRAAAHRAVARRRPSPTLRSRGVWRMAATIGVMIAGGWSVVMVRSGGLGMVTNGRSDTAQLAAAIARADTPVSDLTAPNAALASTTRTPEGSGVAVSFGDLGQYTDEELQRVLDRLDQWDGSTSAEAVTSAPILTVPRGGILE